MADFNLDLDERETKIIQMGGQRQGLAEWERAANGSQITQLGNRDASVLLSKRACINIDMEGYIRVDDGNDGDGIGIAFSAQGSKSTSQSSNHFC